MNASPFEIAATGLAIHRAQMDAIARNIAGAGVRTADADASAQHVVTSLPVGPSFEDLFANSDADGASFSPAIDEDDGGSYGPFAAALAPDVAASDVTAPDASDPIQQMVALVAAGRAYDADVASLQAAKQMDVEAIDVDRS